MTLCVLDNDLDPDAVSKTLNLSPTSSHRLGDRVVGGARARVGGWYLRSEDAVVSKDTREHIDWLLGQLAGRQEALQGLRAQGRRTVVSIYWGSAHGHGGPTLDAELMSACGALGLDIWFDVYFLGERPKAVESESE